MSKFTLCAFADEASDSLTGQIDAMRENGVTMLELRSVDGENVSIISSAKAKEIRKKLDTAGIQVWSIGSPSGKIGIKDDFGPHLDQFRHMVELAEILGAFHYRLFSFYGCEGASARDTVLERLSRFVEAAAGSGLVLCHENEREIYGEKAPQCLDIHCSIPEIKAVFDPSNFIQAGQPTLEAWDILEPYVEYMHVKDAYSDGTVVPAGEGDGNLPELLRRYAKIGGKVLSLEPHLAVFSGFSGLGRNAVPIKWEYPTQRAAFDTAAQALYKLAEG